MISDCCVPAPPLPVPYIADEIIIYGTRLNSMDDYASISVPPLSSAINYVLRVQLFEEDVNRPGIKKEKYAVVAAYGYAFEGHCYRLDRPKILVFADQSVGTPAEGCGFIPNEDRKFGYSMWRIRSKTMLLELGVTGDFAEKLLLDANLPGRRAPNTYNAQLVVGHRGGLLTLHAQPARRPARNAPTILKEYDHDTLVKADCQFSRVHGPRP